MKANIVLFCQKVVTNNKRLQFIISLKILFTQAEHSMSYFAQL